MLSCKCWLSGLAYSIPLSKRMFSGTSRSAAAAITCMIVEPRRAQKNVFKAGMKGVLKASLASSSNDHRFTKSGTRTTHLKRARLSGGCLHWMRVRIRVDEDWKKIGGVKLGH